MKIWFFKIYWTHFFLQNYKKLIFLSKFIASDLLIGLQTMGFQNLNDINVYLTVQDIPSPYVSILRFLLYVLVLSGVFSTGAMGAMAPVILRKRLIAPAVSTRNGKILLTLGTRNIKILNTPLCAGSIICTVWFFC